MTNMILRDDLVARLQEIAERENRPIDDVVESLLDQYVEASQSDDVAYQAKLRDFRSKLYGIAREYWQRVGDNERLALTDKRLDEQFWLIDDKGIPRLKSEQDVVELPPDPLADFVGLARHWQNIIERIMTILVDTSFFVALSFPRDTNHKLAKEAMRQIRDSRIVATPVLVELFYVVKERMNYDAALRALGLARSSAFQIESPGSTDLEHMQEIMVQYRDAALDFTDVAQMAICERSNIQRILHLQSRYSGKLSIWASDIAEVARDYKGVEEIPYSHGGNCIDWTGCSHVNNDSIF